jgi:hypothetical protein
VYESVEDVRLLCAESGHWWSDTPFIVTTRQRVTFGERVQLCMRQGCERQRITKISVRTGEQIGAIRYRGKIARIGRTYRADLRKEILVRQNG